MKNRYDDSNEHVKCCIHNSVTTIKCVTCYDVREFSILLYISFCTVWTENFWSVFFALENDLLLNDFSLISILPEIVNNLGVLHIMLKVKALYA